MFKTVRSLTGSFASGRRYAGRIQIPTVIPNNTYWFSSFENTAAEFGSVLSDGSTVTTWKDKSGAAHDLNKAGANSVKPTFKTNIQNGAGALYFDGVNDSLNINPITFMQSQSQFTLFVVAKATTLSANSTLTTTDTAGYNLFYNGTNWAVTAGGGTGTSTVVGDSNIHIFTMIYNGTLSGNSNRLKFQVDKVAQSLNFGATTVGATTSAAATYFYAGQNSTGTVFYNGYMMEVVLYARALNAAEIDGVENYFIDRWRIV